MSPFTPAAHRKCFLGGSRGTVFTVSGSPWQPAPHTYLPKATPLAANLLRGSGLLGVAVELLQVTDQKMPRNGEIFSQGQFLEISDSHHLRKEERGHGDK